MKKRYCKQEMLDAPCYAILISLESFSYVFILKLKFNPTNFLSIISVALENAF